MRRLAALTAALVVLVLALAVAPIAGASVQNSFFNGGSVMGFGTLGGNTFSLLLGQNMFGGGGLGGGFTFSASDANGDHSFSTTLTCLGLNADGTNATILGAVNGTPVGEPAN